MLSNYQIMLVTSSHVCTSDKPSGVYAIDTFPQKPKKYPTFWIINTVKASEKYGHWFSVFFPHQNQPSEFYCSLGKKPEDYSTNLVSILIANGDGRYKLCNDQSQPEDSLTCGYFCLWFVDQRCRNYSYETCMLKLTKNDLVSNEKKVVDYVVEHMKPVPINSRG